MPRTWTLPDAASVRLVRLALRAVLAVGLLGACSVGAPAPVAVSTSAAPTVAPSPAQSAAPATPSPTSTPKPGRPAAMDTVNLEGAIATATYFLSLYPYVYNTGDLTDWKSLTHPECVFCASVAANVEKMQAVGHHQVGTDTIVVSATGAEVDPGVWFSVEVNATQGPWSVVDDAGAIVDSGLDKKSYLMRLAVVREAGAWRVREVQVDSR